MRRLLAAITGIALLYACGDDDATPSPVDAGVEAGADAGVDAIVPKGARTLGIAVAVDSVDFPDQAHAIADAGARTTDVSFPWDDVELPFDAGPDATDDAAVTYLSQPGLHVAGLVAYTENLKPTVAVPALDATGARLPTDLVGRALDDADVRARYRRVIDYVLAQLSDADVGTYLVADVADVALGGDAAKWSAFATFVGDAVNHVHEVNPAVRAGFVVTSDGLLQKKDVMSVALDASDVVAIAHVGDVTGDLDAIVGAAPAGKPILVYAVGRPSEPDEARQAAFVGEVFASWDRHVDRIPTLTFFELDDARDRTTTFGLRRSKDGKTKPAFQALVGAARARGF